MRVPQVVFVWKSAWNEKKKREKRRGTDLPVLVEVWTLKKQLNTTYPLHQLDEAQGLLQGGHVESKSGHHDEAFVSRFFPELLRWEVQQRGKEWESFDRMTWFNSKRCKKEKRKKKSSDKCLCPKFSPLKLKQNNDGFTYFKRLKSWWKRAKMESAQYFYFFFSVAGRKKPTPRRFAWRRAHDPARKSVPKRTSLSFLFICARFVRFWCPENECQCKYPAAAT